MEELPEYDPSKSFSPLLMSFAIPLAISPLAKEEKVSAMVFPISEGVFEMLHWIIVSLSKILSIGIS